MKDPKGLDPCAEKLTLVLEIAREQREGLARGDLEAVQRLQRQRQQLWKDIQSLDKPESRQGETALEILALDRHMVCLLLSEVADIKEKMLKINSLRKLLRSRPGATRPPTHQLSRHI